MKKRREKKKTRGTVSDVRRRRSDQKVEMRSDQQMEVRSDQKMEVSSGNEKTWQKAELEEVRMRTRMGNRRQMSQVVYL